MTSLAMFHAVLDRIARNAAELAAAHAGTDRITLDVTIKADVALARAIAAPALRYAATQCSDCDPAGACKCSDAREQWGVPMSAVKRERRYCREFTRCSCGCGVVMLPRATQWTGFYGSERVVFADTDHFMRFLEERKARQ
jgi:hypothetical protein